MHSTQHSFHSPNPFSQTSRSFNLINNRPPLTAPRHPSFSQIVNLSPSDIRRLDGSQIKRLQAQTQIRRRYHRMIELQHRNFLEKHQLETEREELLKKQQDRADSKAKQLRSELLQLGRSTRDWHYRNRCEGAELRQQRVLNHRYRVERDSSELQRKKMIVSQHQRSFRMRAPRRPEKVELELE